MNNKNITAVYPSASAPLLAEGTYRVVQPFEVAAEATNVQPYEGDALMGDRPARGSRPNVIKNGGKVESKEAAQKIANSKFDGMEIVHGEHRTVIHAESNGQVEHQQNQRKICHSNVDDVSELGASLPLDTHVEENPIGYTFCTPNPEEAKIRANNAATEAPRPKKYQPAEYTSMYDAEGGYKMEEYKSIYD